MTRRSVQTSATSHPGATADAASASSSRIPFFDALKAIASQLIVLHHLIAYGPMSEVARRHLPGLVDWLYYDARMSVQVFFVLGGYLAARALAPDLLPRMQSPAGAIWKRFGRLALPCFAAVLISVACAAVARTLIDDPSLPAPPTLTQLLAHALLLHDVLGYDALSAGVWYVAIDLQLFALMAVLLWAARLAPGRLQRAAVLVLMTTAASVSLYVINRDTSWDIYAPYFFGVYMLGAAAFWATAPGRSPLWLVLVAAIVAGALAIHFRERVAFAALIALAICVVRCSGLIKRWPESRVLAFLGRISFSVFLIHYPVSMLMNAAVQPLFGDHPVANIGGLVVTWILSVAAGAVFYRYVESRVGAAPRSRGTSAHAATGRDGNRIIATS